MHEVRARGHPHEKRRSQKITFFIEDGIARAAATTGTFVRIRLFSESLPIICFFTTTRLVWPQLLTHAHARFARFAQKSQIRLASTPQLFFCSSTYREVLFQTRPLQRHWCSIANGPRHCSGRPNCAGRRGANLGQIPFQTRLLHCTVTGVYDS